MEIGQRVRHRNDPAGAPRGIVDYIDAPAGVAGVRWDDGERFLYPLELLEPIGEGTSPFLRRVGAALEARDALALMGPRPPRYGDVGSPIMPGRVSPGTFDTGVAHGPLSLEAAHAYVRMVGGVPAWARIGEPMREAPAVYAVCLECGHLEPRPAHAAEDWLPAECGHGRPELLEDLEEAEELSARHAR